MLGDFKGLWFWFHFPRASFHSSSTEHDAGKQNFDLQPFSLSYLFTHNSPNGIANMRFLSEIDFITSFPWVKE